MPTIGALALDQRRRRFRPVRAPDEVHLGFNFRLLEADFDAQQMRAAIEHDPVWRRSGFTIRGRDGCRVPLPWESITPPYGFSATPGTWLPMEALPPDTAVWLI